MKIRENPALGFNALAPNYTHYKQMYFFMGEVILVNIMTHMINTSVQIIICYLEFPRINNHRGGKSSFKYKESAARQFQSGFFQLQFLINVLLSSGCKLLKMWLNS